MLGVAAALALLAGAPARAEAQGPAQVYTDPGTGRLIYIADLSGRQPGEVRIGFTGQVYWFFNPLDLLQPAFGCAIATPGFDHLAFCQGQAINGLLVRLGPGANDARVVEPFPLLPGPNLIQGNRKDDRIQGGNNDEQINGGKGNDVIDAGRGVDDVNTGAGNDKANTKDGEVDRLNGGKGKDAATVDKKDKVKNVEKVKRR